MNKYLGNYRFLEVVEKHFGLTFDDLLILSKVRSIDNEEFIAMFCVTEEIKEEIYLTISRFSSKKPYKKTYAFGEPSINLVFGEPSPGIEPLRQEYYTRRIIR